MITKEEIISTIIEKGTSLNYSYPGNNDVALKINDALRILDLIKDSEMAIFGGDVLSENDEGLIYAYQLWGEEYHVLNWYCEKNDEENDAQFQQRSVKEAFFQITQSSKIAESLSQNCFIVFVL